MPENSGGLWSKDRRKADGQIKACCVALNEWAEGSHEKWRWLSCGETHMASSSSIIIRLSPLIRVLKKGEHRSMGRAG